MKNLLMGGASLLAMLSLNTRPAAAQASMSEAIPHAAPTKLENADIVDMVKAGLPEEIIIAKVQGTPGNFDTSPTALTALKTSQVPNAVILAMVKKSSPTNNNEERSATSPSANKGTTSLGADPRKSATQQLVRGCMAVKPIGSHAFRNVVLFGVAGALISHAQYQVVDAVDYPAKIGQKYHGNDLQTIEGNGTRVVLLDKRYSADELHMACRQ
jgi:hypothetical protein